MGLWDSLDKRLGQWFLPQAREAKAGDELAKALESLSKRDTGKVNAGMTLLNALKNNQTVEVKQDGNNS